MTAHRASTASHTSTKRRTTGRSRSAAGPAPKIADHAARDQRLHDRIAVGMAQRHLGAARSAARGLAMVKPNPAQRSSTRRMKVSVSAIDFCRSARWSTCSSRSTPASSAIRLRIGGVPDRNCVMPGGLVRALEGELPGVAEPAGDRLPGLVVPALGDEQERGRAGPAVQVLVAAPDRQIDLGRSRGRPARRRRCGRDPTRRAPPSCAARVSRAMSCMRPVR